MRAARKQWQRLWKGFRRQGHVVAGASPPWLKRLLGPPVDYLDMLLVDHGVFRLVYLNRHTISPRAERTAQPAPHDLAGFARRGIKTVLNLRGPRDCGAYRLERRACAAAGLELVDFTLRSRAAPEPETVREAARLLAGLAYPMVMHCKSGADRAGLMATLYLHLQEGVPIAEARRQLDWRFGHFKQGPTGILDAFFEAYLAYAAERPIAFLDWVERVYDPVALKRDFKATGWGSFLVDKVLRRE